MWFTSTCNKARPNYLKAKRLFKTVKSQDSKIHMQSTSKNYRKCTKTAKNDYYTKLHKEIRMVKKVDPSKYWNTINKASGSNVSVIIISHYKPSLSISGTLLLTMLGSSAITCRQTMIFTTRF